MIFTADQLSKKLIAIKIPLFGKNVIAEDFFWIIHIRNEGGAFGILSHLDNPLRRIIFVLIPGIAIAVFLIYLFRSADLSLLNGVALSLIVGGALGNFIDRLRFGSVLDFIDVHWFDRYHYPAFNIADSAITVGAIILAIDLIAGMTIQKKQITQVQ